MAWPDAISMRRLGFRSRPLPAIFFAGLIAGTMDITAALIVYGSFGLRPVPMLQGIARGLIGMRAMHGAVATALLGLLCHFTIAFGAAAVYYMVSRVWCFLLTQYVVCGVLYGICVFFFMDRIVVPMATGRHPTIAINFLFIGLAIHICCVGLPIAIAVRRNSL